MPNGSKHQYKYRFYEFLQELSPRQREFLEAQILSETNLTKNTWQSYIYTSSMNMKLDNLVIIRSLFSKYIPRVQTIDDLINEPKSPSIKSFEEKYGLT